MYTLFAKGSEDTNRKTTIGIHSLSLCGKFDRQDYVMGFLREGKNKRNDAQRPTGNNKTYSLTS